MTKSKTTKKALFASALSLILCFAMLLGTTYAWFTDSVTSANNIIKSGTLDIALEYQSLDNGTWGTKTEITNEAQSTAIFNYDKWEPGYSEVKLVTISNKGTLALKYKLNVVAHLKDGETAVSKLADVIDVYYLELPAGTASVTAPTSFAEAKAAGLVKVGTLADVINNNITTANGALLPAGSTATPTEKEAVGSVSFVMMLHMQEEAGNEYQDLSIGKGFDLQLLATQYTEETDSFDDQYDKDAEYPTIVKSVSELQDALASGGNIVLSEKIETTGLNVTIPQDTVVNLDLAGNDFSAVSSGTMEIGKDAVLNIVNTADTDAELALNQTVMGENATVNISDVELTCGAFYAFGDNGTINFNSGKLVVSEDAPICLANGSTFNMNGGEIIVNAAGVPAIAVVSGGGTVNLNAGKIDVQNGYAILGGVDDNKVYVNIAKDFVITCADGTAEIFDPNNKVILNDNRN